MVYGHQKRAIEKSTQSFYDSILLLRLGLCLRLFFCMFPPYSVLWSCCKYCQGLGQAELPTNLCISINLVNSQLIDPMILEVSLVGSEFECGVW